MGDDDNNYVEISDLDEAWSFLAEYCLLKEYLYTRLTGVALETMTLIYKLNIIDRRDIPAIHTHINNILNDMKILPANFKGYFNDDLDRVRLVDILEYLRDHISTPGQGLTVTVGDAKGSEIPELLVQLKGLVGLDQTIYLSLKMPIL